MHIAPPGMLRPSPVAKGIGLGVAQRNGMHLLSGCCLAPFVLLLLALFVVPGSSSTVLQESSSAVLQQYAATQSSYYRKLVIHTHYGLGNRIISLVSAVALAIVDERSIAVIWDGVEELLVFPFLENVVVSERGPCFLARAPVSRRPHGQRR